MRKVKNSNQKNKKFNAKMQTSLLFVFFVVIVVFVVLLGRVMFLEQKDGDKYKKKVLSQQTYVSNVLPYKRGEIRDSKGTVLARSERVYNVILDIKLMLQNEDYIEPTSKALVDNFDITREELDKLVKDKPKSQYNVLFKKLKKDEIEGFQKAASENKKIKGVWFEEQYLRTYPYNELASDVIGFSTADNTGLSGLEYYYNTELNGVNGREYGYYDSELNLDRNVKPAVGGNTLITTIDVNIQSIVEKKINAYAKDPGCKNIAVVVANPKNGEIIAMASKDQYDLNNPFDLSKYFTKKEISKMTEEEKTNELNKIWKNSCISDIYEPGSTFKPFTIAMALEEGTIKPDDKFVCDGKEMVAGIPIRCSNRGGHGVITVTQALMVSCNDALMQMAEKAGKTKFAKYQDLFNIGKKTGIDLSGEEPGLVYSADKLGPTELATSSFGQSVAVNMVQMVAGFSALINGGQYYQPHLVKQILDENDTAIKNIDNVLMKQVVSSKTSEFLRHALYETVREGTARTAAVEGYNIGGKTGTAQKHPIVKGNEKYIVSFIGFAPVEDPSVVIYVIVDEPNQVPMADSSIATKMASSILKDILPFLEVYPSGDVELLPEISKSDEEFNANALPAEGETGEDDEDVHGEQDNQGAPEEDPQTVE